MRMDVGLLGDVVPLHCWQGAMLWAQQPVRILHSVESRATNAVLLLPLHTSLMELKELPDTSTTSQSESSPPRRTKRPERLQFENDAARH